MTEPTSPRAGLRVCPECLTGKWSGLLTPDCPRAWKQAALVGAFIRRARTEAQERCKRMGGNMWVHLERMQTVVSKKGLIYSTVAASIAALASIAILLTVPSILQRVATLEAQVQELSVTQQPTQQPQ